MYLIKKIIYIPIIIFIFDGCASKEADYTFSRYHSPSSGSNYRYIHPKNESIKDSLAMHRATSNSYKVAGVKYYPKMVNLGDTFKGIASWYGPDFHAKKTSNGEIYNMYAFTAAHKTLPMNTMVKVINLENNKEVIVRVNDRGPFVGTRIIDLSNAAARAIDMVKKGTAQVRLEVLSISAKAKAQYNGNGLYSSNTSKSRENVFEAIYVQLGAFSKKSGAKSLRDSFRSSLYKSKIIEVVNKKRKIYKVFIYGFKSESEAKDFIDSSDINGLHIIRQDR